LGAVAIRAALESVQLNPKEVSEVIMGSVVCAAQGQAPARQALIYAGLPQSTAAMTVNKVCGSGLKAVMLATQTIKLGDAEVIVAGGMENMSLAPYALTKARSGYRMGHGELLDLMIYDGLWDPYHNCHMGIIGEKCAKEHKITREMQDAYAAESTRRALAAIESGRFKDEIVPVETTQKKGEKILVDTDEEPRRANPQKLPQLRPAFEKEGTITAGNASSINDGAAAVVLMSAAKAKSLGLKPLAKIVGYAQASQDPDWFTTAPAVAMQNLLDKLSLKASDIDLWEVNEAFAVVSLYNHQKIGIPHDRANVNGGAISLGHPIGAAGARLLTTLLYEMHKRSQARRGIVSLCIGGGESVAVLVEKL
jgi:acetyl-CoA C-acetyltransferase